MIVSHKHKLIFLKPRKVAGTSFEIALSKFLDADDIISPVSRDDEIMRTELGFQAPVNFNFALVDLIAGRNEPMPMLMGRELPLKYYNHMPSWLVKLYLGQSMFSSYRKISIVRNPWDRAVSLFFYKNRRTKPTIDEFTAYFEAHPTFLGINRRNYFIGSQMVVDTFIRYERFEADIRALEAEIPGLTGLWDAFSSTKAKGSTRDRTLTPAEIFAAHPKVDAMIKTANAWDIETFGYSLGR